MELVQGTPDWLAARAGSLGASQVHEALTRTKTGWGAGRANIKARMVAERLTGQPQESFSNAAMQWGNDWEDAARTAYAFLHGVTVAQMGLAVHPTIKGTHASPDGLVGDKGLVEIKCPNTATHIETLKSQIIPAKYQTQMLWQMICLGREWCDFASFDPRMPEEMQLFVARLHRDDARVAELESGVAEFIAEVDADVAALTTLYRKAA